jgi:endonuclease/exonuclease/phosphatase family metal-dependent hydrolase
VGRRERPTPHRYDYIFASHELVAQNCTYLSGWVERGYCGRQASDHVPVEAKFSSGS